VAPADSAAAAQQRAQAATARHNRALREKLRREQEKKAQERAVEEQRRLADARRREAAVAANEAAAKAEAEQAQRRVREQWGGEDGIRIRDALAALESPDNDRVRRRDAATQLLRLLTALQRGTPLAPIQFDATWLVGAHGTLLVLLACGFQANQHHRMLEPPQGGSVPPRAALAQAIGELTRLAGA
jgi:hypothetical protein